MSERSHGYMIATSKTWTVNLGTKRPKEVTRSLVAIFTCRLVMT
jgi:hypothetical protein